MRRNFLILGFLLGSSQILSADDQRTPYCLQFRSTANVPKALRREGLDPDWNLEYPGVDLAQEAILNFEKKKTLSPVSMVALEVGKTETHSEAVTALLRRFSVKAKLEALRFDKSEQELVDALKKITADKVAVVNFSRTIGAADSIFEAFQKLSEIALPVVGVGDYYPKSSPLNDYRVKAIMVGSLHPLGMLSDFSEEPDRNSAESGIDVLVPSDYWLTYKGAKGDYARFGYNSGAAPQIAGVLADLASLLPGIEVDEARFLVRESAIPGFQDPPRIFNAYHLIRWALHLREQGGKNGWRVLLQIDRPIEKFNDEAQELLKGAKADAEAFVAKAPRTKEECEKGERAIRAVRAAFLLTSYSTRLSDRALKADSKKLSQLSASLLSQLYEKIDLEFHAHFYENQDNVRLLANLENYITGEDVTDGRAAVRMAAQQGKKGGELVDLALKRGRPSVKEWAVYAGVENARSPRDFLTAALDFAKDGQEDPILKAVAFSTSGMSGTAMSPYLSRFADQSMLAEKQKAVRGLLLHALLKKGRGKNVDAEEKAFFALKDSIADSKFEKELSKQIADAQEALRTAK